MSRKLKNIIMIGLLVILIGTSCFSIYSVKNSTTSNEVIFQNINENPQEMPNNNSNMEEPPAKPEGEENDSIEMESNEPPEMPNGNSEMNNGGMNNDNQNINNQQSSANISTIYYILFISQSIVISLLLIYLIMSKFNKKTLKETLNSTDKITIFILSFILLTIVLSFLEIIISKKLITNVYDNSMNNNFNPNNMVDNITYSSAKEINSDSEITSGEYTSNTADENAILVTGNITASLNNITISKTGDSNGGDNTSFYGINSGIIAKDGANLIIKNTTITTNATGANGVFSYGGSATTNNENSDGTTIEISDSKITTTKDNSGGIMTTGGGITNATNLTITTQGVSSAAIRTDRGGGTVNVDGGSYTTSGSGSPAIYSTAEITVKNATLISKVAEGIVIEGKNSVLIDNCQLTDNNPKLNGLSSTYKNIFLYQSMSGDADTGNATFTSKNSTITTNNGDSFYITNTTATINLENNTIINNDKTGNFLRAQADSWGNSGSNGGDVTLNLSNQDITGNIVIDNISRLKMELQSNSSYEGIINNKNTAKSIELILDKSSKIKLTGDSYITSLINEDTDNSNIDFNGYKLYVNGQSLN